MLRNKLVLIVPLMVIAYVSCANDTLKEKLKSLPNVVEVNKINIDTTFNSQYELFFNQPIDHKNPELGSFKQRVVLNHLSDTLPMVAVLEGYGIWSGYASEPAKILQSNQIRIEHRFFNDSRPDSIPWSKLTIWQAATDQHEIIQALKNIYKANWLTTGISKGGQTTMYHRSFYPNDVKASIPYVAPLNFAREDKRIYNFLDSVGTKEQREAIYNFQLRCFKHENELEELLKKRAEKQKWEFKFGIEKAIQYTILEYPFAYWQWGGTSISNIPYDTASVVDIFVHLHGVADFTFFEENSIDKYRPFFWAALTQIGMYGYRTQPFKEYLGDTTDYTFDFAAPEGIRTYFDTIAMQKVKYFLDNEASNMLFIIGGLDTWGATSYIPSGKNNLIRKVLIDGHHGTRINDFPPAEKQFMYNLLGEWMGVNVKIEAE